jgi:hypothetical protein
VLVSIQDAYFASRNGHVEPKRLSRRIRRDVRLLPVRAFAKKDISDAAHGAHINPRVLYDYVISVIRPLAALGKFDRLSCRAFNVEVITLLIVLPSHVKLH